MRVSDRNVAVHAVEGCQQSRRTDVTDVSTKAVQPVAVVDVMDVVMVKLLIINHLLLPSLSVSFLCSKSICARGGFVNQVSTVPDKTHTVTKDDQ